MRMRTRVAEQTLAGAFFCTGFKNAPACPEPEPTTLSFSPAHTFSSRSRMSHDAPSDNGALQSALRSLRVREVLCELPNAKRVCLHANIDTHDASTDTTITDDAVLVLEQATLGDNPVALQELFGASSLHFSADFLNDRYAKYKMSLQGAPSCMYMNLSVTTKATAKDIDKYRPRDRVLVRETPLAYTTVVAPFIDARPTKETKWLINILEGTAEQDRMLYSDPDPTSGFVLLPDMKWDQVNMKQLYGQAIVRDLSLRSIRDLRVKHLPMLRTLRQQCMTSLTQKYGVRPEHIFAYFHYQPSYYLLHVHFVHFAYDAAGSQACYRAHMLDDVIDNLENFKCTGAGDDTEYYVCRTLNYFLSEGDQLLTELREKHPQCLINMD